MWPWPLTFSTENLVFVIIFEINFVNFIHISQFPIHILFSPSPLSPCITPFFSHSRLTSYLFRILSTTDCSTMSACYWRGKYTQTPSVPEWHWTRCYTSTWNSLPVDIRLCENILTFERHLKTHLFKLT